MSNLGNMNPRHASTARLGGRTLRTGLSLATIGAVLAGVLAAATTWALWSTSAVFAGGTVTAGDLRMAVVGTSTWERVTAPTDRLPRLTADGTNRVTTMPGETVRITTTVESFLRGDNLAAGFSATFAHASVLEAVDATMTITVLNADNTIAAGPVPLGEVLAVPGLYGNNAGVTHTHRLVIEVTIDGEFNWTRYLDPALGPNPGSHWPGGNLTFSLEQVREGAGFIAGGTP